jgi:hypothetical protein
MFHVGAAALSVVLAMWIGVQIRARWPAYQEARKAARVERTAA